MVWISIFAVIIIFFSFIGGFREGAVKSFFSLVTIIIAIPIAGTLYHLLASLLSFLPGKNWENFIGFIITLALISVILRLLFLLPRKLIQKIWRRGMLFRLIGGAINIFNSAIGLVVFALLLLVYPIWGWLEQAVAGSSVLGWLASQLSFVQALLPEIFHQAVNTIVASPMLSLVLMIHR